MVEDDDEDELPEKTVNVAVTAGELELINRVK
jgi:hypothetical protein